jgi:hypothetical protein
VMVLVIILMYGAINEYDHIRFNNEGHQIDENCEIFIILNIYFHNVDLGLEPRLM